MLSLMVMVKFKVNKNKQSSVVEGHGNFQDTGQRPCCVAEASEDMTLIS